MRRPHGRRCCFWSLLKDASICQQMVPWCTTVYTCANLTQAVMSVNGYTSLYVAIRCLTLPTPTLCRCLLRDLFPSLRRQCRRPRQTSLRCCWINFGCDILDLMRGDLPYPSGKLVEVTRT